MEETLADMSGVEFVGGFDFLVDGELVHFIEVLLRVRQLTDVVRAVTTRRLKPISESATLQRVQHRATMSLTRIIGNVIVMFDKSLLYYLK